jgi:hypothetical protein
MTTVMLRYWYVNRSALEVIMPKNRIGVWLFAGGGVVTLLSVTLGNSMQAELRSLPVDTLMQQHGLVSLKFLAFAFGLPLGIELSLLGALMGSENSPGRFWFFLSVGVAAVSAASLVPALWGRQLSSMFFGTGGYSIMLLVLGSIWYWGLYRARLPQASRLAVDLQGMGHLCFAIAAWNICGAATMPSFALEPDIMLAMGSQAFAVGQMKAIMALFIFGWLFTLLGLRLAGKHSAIDHESAEAG